MTVEAAAAQHPSSGWQLPWASRRRRSPVIQLRYLTAFGKQKLAGPKIYQTAPGLDRGPAQGDKVIDLSVQWQ
jgi:hypothetical protein